jgi:hypothetical protein
MIIITLNEIRITLNQIRITLNQINNYFKPDLECFSPDGIQVFILNTLTLSLCTEVKFLLKFQITSL